MTSIVLKKQKLNEINLTFPRVRYIFLKFELQITILLFQNWN